MSEWKQLITSGSDASISNLTVTDDASIVKSLTIDSNSNLGVDQLTLKYNDSYRMDIRHRGWFNVFGDNDFKFQHQGSTNLFISQSGDVGIGTSSPTAKLHVMGDLFVESNDLWIGNNSDSGKRVRLHAAAEGSYIDFGGSSSGDTNKLSFRPNSVNSKMILWNSGRLGIGTAHSTEPTATLEVVGDIVASGNINANGNIIGDDNTDITNINQIYCDSIIHDGDTNTLMGFSSDRIDFYAGHSTQPKFQIQNTKVIVNPNSYSYVDFIAKSDTESHMLFVDAGNNRVGIGTSSPGSRIEVEHNTSAYNYISIVNSSNTINTVKAFAVQKAGADTMLVYSSGNIYNSNNSYGGFSDIRLKENIISGSSQWNDIKALKFKNYNLKSNPDLVQLGIIAQDLEAAGMSGLIGEHPATDAQIALNSELSGSMVKSVKTSVLHLKAVKALQEAMEKIESLEKRVSDLENF